MTSAKVLTVYRVSPRLLGVEAEDGTVAERSLKELHDGGHRLSGVVRSPDPWPTHRHVRTR
jgi:hypothetical protein